MTTCLPHSKNASYMLLNLVGSSWCAFSRAFTNNRQSSELTIAKILIFDVLLARHSLPPSIKKRSTVSDAPSTLFL